MRIQRTRAKGFRMPPGVVYVGRPTKWGNPWKPADFAIDPFIDEDRTPEECAALAVTMYRKAIVNGDCGVPTIDVIGRELRGKTLACWCPAGSPCHADVLAEIANSEE